MLSRQPKTTGIVKKTTARKSRRSFPLPVVSPRFVETYLNRPLLDFDWLKGVPKEELYQHATSELGFRFATECWHNQLVCFAIAASMKEFLFFLKMGGGKSKVVLDQIRYRKRRKELVRACILAPELLHVDSWAEQLRTHAPDLSYQLLVGDKNERFDLINRPSDVCVMNYKGLEVYMSRRGRVGVKTKQQLSPEIASEFASRFNFVVFDESHRLGNHRSLVFELCRWLSMSAEYRYALSGTPFGRDPAKLWPQFMLIDHGATLGRTLGTFRNVFFTPKQDYWKGVEWTFNRDMLSSLNRVIKNRSITYELEELRDMPKKVLIKLPVRLVEEGRVYYDRIISGLREQRGDYRSLGNVFVRMRQCASGFLALRADDESRIEVQFKANPKLTALKEFLLSKDDKVLVFHEFIHSGVLIERLLEEMKIGYASLRGSTKDSGAQYSKFLNDPKCRVFVLNNQLGSEAINPQYVCRRAVFYESPVSPIRREQAEGRIHRPGQQWTTFVYDLTVLGTVEEKILRFVKEGRDLLRAVLAGDLSLLEIGMEENKDGLV